MSRYTDVGGDIWEDVDEGHVRAVTIDGREIDFAEPVERDHVVAKWGPLVYLDGGPLSRTDHEEPAGPPFLALPTVSDVMSRAAIYQSAHALVTGLKWEDGEAPSVYDVLQVAKWLGEEDA
ncbi:hypothetical protein [Streptomyces longwoodensis]|uniref:hypothetical protein n=1 Tax=Streptomyces longwoodensis TaxID=68231 RepID=UPI0033C0F62F